MPSSPYPPNLLSRRLEQVGRVLRKAADEIYRRECKMDIDHLRVLRIISAAPGQPVNWVVNESNFDRTVVSRMITKLVKKNLVERTIAPNDARQFLLKTTAAGEQLARRAVSLGDALNADLLSVFDRQELQVFQECLAKLAQWKPKQASRATGEGPSRARGKARERAPA